jgi:protein TonB
MAHEASPEPAFSSLPVSAPDPRPAQGALTGGVSLILHALAIGAVLLVPLLSDDSLPERADQVYAFFPEPMELAPAPVAPRTEAPREVQVSGLTAPVELPSEIVPEAGLDLGVEGGLPGGVEGGIPGGVVGGVVGGLPDAPPPPPVQPLRVGLNVKEPRKLKDVLPVYPAIAVAGRLEGVVVVECLIDTRGRVQEAKVLRGMPLLDEAALEAVRQWVYMPTLLNGEPIPVIMTVTVNFRLRPDF